MVVSKRSLAKIALIISIGSTIYSPKINLFAQQPKDVSEQKRAFVTLDDLIRDATFLEKYAPLSVSGKHEIFILNDNDEIIVRQDFSIHSQRFIDDGMQLLFGKGENRQDPRNFLGTVNDVLHYLEQEDIRNQELIRYISRFQAIKVNSFDGQLHIVRFQDFQQVSATHIESQDNLNKLIEQGIIAQNPDYYFLSEHIRSQMNDELRSAGICNKDSSSLNHIFDACKVLSQTIDFCEDSNKAFSNRSLEEAREYGKAECREIVQYIIQIYYSLFKKEYSQTNTIHMLPVGFTYAQKGSYKNHLIAMIIDSSSQIMTFFDPTQIIRTQNEIRRLRQQAYRTLSSEERYDLEQKVQKLERIPYDCSEYPFKSRRNNR